MKLVFVLFVVTQSLSIRSYESTFVTRDGSTYFVEFPFVRVKSISSGKGFLAFFTGCWQMAGCHVSFQGGAEKNKNRPERRTQLFLLHKCTTKRDITYIWGQDFPQTSQNRSLSTWFLAIWSSNLSFSTTSTHLRHFTNLPSEWYNFMCRSRALVDLIFLTLVQPQSRWKDFSIACLFICSL